MEAGRSTFRTLTARRLAGITGLAVSDMGSELREAWWAVVRGICERALHGQITLNELYEKWPRGAQGEPVVEPVYRDVEDGVEHFPARLVTAEPDYEFWHASELYRALLLDHYLLRHARNEAELLECRQKVRNEGDALYEDSRPEDIERAVRHCVSSP